METKMIQGILLQRYKRFLADVKLDSGEVITAYCCNTGKLLGVPENARILLRDHGANTQRKLRYTWECFKDGDTWVGINTNDANTIVHNFLLNKQILDLCHYPIIRREVKYGTNSRIDFLLEHNDQRLYLEVKSVHMRRGTTAVFPDCPTVRGTKHLGELSHIINQNTRAAVLYLVQRDDCDAFSVAADLDPVYAAASLTAKACGVETMALSIKMNEMNDPKFKQMLPAY
jgi:sugar fermentation stimulation protein A